MHATQGKSTKFRWRTVDIVTAAAIAVVMGVVFWAWGLVWAPLSAVLGVLPGVAGVLNGPWLIAGVLGALIIRKPGAALFTELLAATVSALIGSQWGILTLVSGVVQGLGAELVFAIFAYSQWRLWTAVLAAIGSSIALAANDLIVWYPGADALFQTVYLVRASSQAPSLRVLVRGQSCRASREQERCGHSVTRSR